MAGGYMAVYNIAKLYTIQAKTFEQYKLYIISFLIH